MMARRESSVAARTASVEAAGWAAVGAPVGAAARSAIFAPSLASTAGHMPSSAESQSGRAGGAARWIQAGSCEARFTSLALSCREAKKARQEGSTALGADDP